MNPFTTLSGIAAPLPLANVDTDAIMPKQFLKTIKRTGLGRFIFYDTRYAEGEVERPEFILNRKPYRNACILIAGANFGCGSSREHAPWGLADFGIRCVIAPSFADIFASNCVKNGLLCVTLPAQQVEQLQTIAADPQTAAMTVDLERQVIVTHDGAEWVFDIEPGRKHTLLAGLDEIGLTMQHAEAIARFERSRIWREPWRNNGSALHD